MDAVLVTSTTGIGRRKICVVATIPFPPLNVFMRPHIEALRAEYDLTLVANGTAEDVANLVGERVSFTPVKIQRDISVVSDCMVLISLWRLFRREKFDCVHSISPKSGFLAMLAARLAGVPLRFHTFTGQVWITRKGYMQLLLKFLDKVLVANTTMALADGPSQRSFLIEEKIVKSSAIQVLADGSFFGVDVDRFTFKAEARQRIRIEHRIAHDGIVFLYVGRLNRDKGILDLFRAYAYAAERAGNAHLLVVGRDEHNLESELDRLMRQFPGRVHRVSYTDRPEDFMSAADVLCLPSYREGFSNVVIEAATAGLPVVASRIYGIVDAVEEGVTGFLHAPGSVREMTAAMMRLSGDRDLRREMGRAARERTAARFPQKRVTEALVEFYHERFAHIRGPGRTADR